MKFYTYLWQDPKDNSPLYVGKGCGNRAFTHLKSKSELGQILRTRKEEGYVVEPTLSYWATEKEALSIETLWILCFGRRDLGTGTLLNVSKGGQGSPSVWTEERKRKHSERMKAMHADPAVKARHRRAVSSAMNQPEMKQILSERRSALNANPQFKQTSRLRAVAVFQTPEVQQRRTEGVRRYYERKGQSYER